VADRFISYWLHLGLVAFHFSSEHYDMTNVSTVRRLEGYMP